MKRQKKKKKKNREKQFDYTKRNRLTDFEMLTFSFDFTLSSKYGVTNRNFLNHICVYSCLVPTSMLT